MTTAERTSRRTVEEDVAAALKQLRNPEGGSASPPSMAARVAGARLQPIGYLSGSSDADRETARRVNAFLRDPRGTAVHQTTDDEGNTATMRFARDGDRVRVTVRAAQRGGMSGVLNAEGTLVDVEDQPEIQVTGLQFRSPNPLGRVESAPGTIRIFTDRNTGRIIYEFDRPMTVSAGVFDARRTVYHQRAGRYYANPPPQTGQRRRGE